MNRIRRFGLSLLLLLFLLSVWINAEDGVLKRSILVVFDLSYSMATIDRGADLSRHVLGVGAVEQLVKEAGRDEEWSLIIAEDAGAVVASGGFTTDFQSFIPVLRKTVPWGTTSVDEMIVAGSRQFSQAAAGTKRFLLLVTDGINTHGQLYRLRQFELEPDLNATPIVVGFSIAEYADYWLNVADWITASGGRFLFYHQTDELRRILDGGDPPPMEAPAKAPVEPPIKPPMEPPVKAHEEAAKRVGEAQPPAGATVFLPIWWIFLIPAAGTAGIMFNRYRKWSDRRLTVRPVENESREAITLVYVAHGGDEVKRTFEEFPVKVGAVGNADLVLERPRISSGARVFQIVRDEEGFKFSANGMFVINGVGRRTHLLSQGDRITFGRYRVVFEGVSHIRTAPPALPKPLFLFYLLPLLLFAVLAVVFREPVAVNRKRTRPQQPQAATLEPARLEHERLNAGERQSGAGFIFVSEPEMPQSATFPTVMWKPGGRPDFFKADVLFFHAHPDDESLDFGVLLRRLADAGKRTAVVLFTDGDSGLDQYPRRMTEGSYPPYRLQGPALAEVRAGEAQAGMSILGVSHYVRLGLKNNPYGGTADVLSTERVIAAWGGEETLLKTLSSLITGYEPDLVVSPDGPAAALEHFEHETVGLLVDAALKELEQKGVYEPKGRLLSVDPLQKALYPDAQGIDATGADESGGLCYRTIQALALGEHHTQRDASVVGLENLSGFDREYYHVFAWNLPLSIEEYLKPR